MVEQKGHAVFLRRDRVVLRVLQDPGVAQVQFEARSGTGIGPDDAVDFERGLLPQGCEFLEQRVGNVAVPGHALNDPGPIPELEKVQLTARAFLVEPAAKPDALVRKCPDVLDADGGGC